MSPYRNTGKCGSWPIARPCRITIDGARNRAGYIKGEGTDAIFWGTSKSKVSRLGQVPEASTMIETRPKWHKVSREIHRFATSVVVIVTIVGVLAACGESVKPVQSKVTNATNTLSIPIVTTRTPPTKQEVVSAARCLKRERVRSATHHAYSPQVPRGANEITRDGLPMTPEEFEVTVHRCLSN